MTSRRDAFRLLTLPAMWALWPKSAAALDDTTSDFVSPEYAERRRLRDDASERLSVEIENLLPERDLGWIVPPNLFVSTEKRSKWEYIYPLEFGFRTAPFSRQLETKEAERIARQYPDAVCDPTQEWFAYRAANAVRTKTQVFAVPDHPANVRVGMYRGPVPPVVVARDFQATQGTLVVRSLGFLNAAKTHRFAQYAGYDKISGEIRRMTVVLYEKDWTLIARHDDEFAEGDTWCDGCRAPRLSDGLDFVFGTFNMIAVQEFPFPLLLSNRSSIESRVITLTTFLEDGRHARDFVGGNVIGCPSFAALIKSVP
jgi:hypothetical protein